MHHLQEVDGFSLSSISYVVFDEADRLFEMGFAEQLKQVQHGWWGGVCTSAGHLCGEGLTWGPPAPLPGLGRRRRAAVCTGCRAVLLESCRR